MSKLLLAILLILTVSCASNAPTVTSRTQIYDRASHTYQKAQEYFALAKYDKALSLLHEAHRDFASIDSTDAVIATAIDIAHTYYKQGDYDNATAMLTTLLTLYPVKSSPELKADILILRANVLVAQGNSDTAVKVANEAMSNCLSNLCKGKAFNLLAKIAIKNLRHQEAFEHSLQALLLLPDATSERANALRLTAYALIELRQFDEALKHLQTALQIDKSFEASSKIKTDLLLMTVALSNLSRCDEAKDTLRRALMIQDVNIPERLMTSAKDSVRGCLNQSKKD